MRDNVLHGTNTIRLILITMYAGEVVMIAFHIVWKSALLTRILSSHPDLLTILSSICIENLIKGEGIEKVEILAAFLKSLTVIQLKQYFSWHC